MNPYISAFKNTLFFTLSPCENYPHADHLTFIKSFQYTFIFNFVNTLLIKMIKRKQENGLATGHLPTLNAHPAI